MILSLVIVFAPLGTGATLSQAERYYQMVIDHIGIVVKSLDEGIAHWQDVFGYRQATEKITNTRQKVHVVFLEKAGSIPIKLVEPADPESAVTALAKRGGGLHHLCFRCEDLNKALQHCKDKKLRVLATPQPGEAFDNENIAFVFAKQGLNVELIDTDKRANRLETSFVPDNGFSSPYS